jgi:hypothetical protein
MRISTDKTNDLAVKGKTSVRFKTVVNERTLEQTLNFNYLDFNVASAKEMGNSTELQRSQQTCGVLAGA